MKDKKNPAVGVTPSQYVAARRLRRQLKAEAAIIMASQLLADNEDYDEKIAPALQAALSYIRGKEAS